MLSSASTILPFVKYDGSAIDILSDQFLKIANESGTSLSTTGSRKLILASFWTVLVLKSLRWSQYWNSTTWILQNKQDTSIWETSKKVSFEETNLQQQNSDVSKAWPYMVIYWILTSTMQRRTTRITEPITEMTTPHCLRRAIWQLNS